MKNNQQAMAISGVMQSTGDLDIAVEYKYSEECYLREQVRFLHESYQRAAKPLIDRLVEIEMMKPPKPFFVALEQSKFLAICDWSLDDEENGIWQSTCGEMWSFIDGGPKENRVRFCHGCGKSVDVVNEEARK